MEELALQFFPLPHVFRGERREGAQVDWPAICSTCDRQCESPTPSREVQLCSYGLNYVRIDDEMVVAGIVVRDFPQLTPARKKRIREVGKAVVTRAALERLIERYKIAVDKQAAELRRRMDEVIDEFRESKEYQREVVELMRPDLERTLGQAHDYKLFVQQVVQNMSVILETKYPGIPLDEKLDAATHEEAAVYWAAVLMDEKLDSALFLEAPERIHEPREQGRFRLHGQVVKYVRIYQRRADAKQVSITILGESWARIQGNGRALGIVPHTLVDNAIKYAPSRSKVVVRFTEREDRVALSVESFGPKIEDDEMSRIFDLFYRGRQARAKSSEGTGFGLAAAQNVAKAHEAEIRVTQTDRHGPEDTYLTTFTVEFEIEGHDRPPAAAA
jgi:signal transduction histidine kinase